jgi:hypothetical protein
MRSISCATAGAAERYEEVVFKPSEPFSRSISDS